MLAVSILAAVVLLAVAAWSFIGRPRRRVFGSGPRAEHDSGVGTPGGWSPPSTGDGRGWLGVLAVTALIFVAGGPVALVVPLLAYLAWLRPGSSGPAVARDPAMRMPVLALAAMIVSGLLSAVRPFGTGMLGPFGWLAQAFALVALAAALMPAVTAARWLRPAGRPAPAAEADR